ncbi:AGAP012604-PA-like protein [Anopheles sinensis]|uniref:AGAP012604-PA-like protein n=1 Tax=Anopheles sinensis TaxID=74873 RepID=A0A084WIV8_ANOSI|nr:AGAP012604-PA-like protein [Anopheles sinensis]
MDLERVDLTKTDIHQIVAEHFARCKETRALMQWRVIEAKLEPFSSCPEGFLAAHYALKVTVEVAIERTENLSFFVKCSPVDNPALACYLKEIRSFHKETHILKDIVTAIQQHCPWPLATLACLHAGSFVVEEKCGKPLPELYPNVLEENAWVTTPNSTRLKDVANVIQLYTELVQDSDVWDESHKKIILLQLPEHFRKIYSFTAPSKQFRNCLNHGDLWCNNLMFKCESNGKPTECILVDYQMSRYVPPAYDINLLLYLTTSRQMRNKQGDALLAHYYNCFSEMLHKNQLAAASILPSDIFLASCEHYRLAGLIHSTMISAEVTLPSVFLEEVFNCSDSTAGFMPEAKMKVCINAFRSNTTYRNHLLELMEELFSLIQIIK